MKILFRQKRVHLSVNGNGGVVAYNDHFGASNKLRQEIKSQRQLAKQGQRIEYNITVLWLSMQPHFR